MKRLLVTFEVMLPEESTNADADTLVEHMTGLAVAKNEVDAYATFPLRPVGRLSDWLFEGHD